MLSRQSFIKALTKKQPIQVFSRQLSIKDVSIFQNTLLKHNSNKSWFWIREYSNCRVLYCPKWYVHRIGVHFAKNLICELRQFWPVGRHQLNFIKPPVLSQHQSLFNNLLPFTNSNIFQTLYRKICKSWIVRWTKYRVTKIWLKSTRYEFLRRGHFKLKSIKNVEQL